MHNNFVHSTRGRHRASGHGLFKMGVKAWPMKYHYKKDGIGDGIWLVEENHEDGIEHGMGRCG